MRHKAYLQVLFSQLGIKWTPNKLIVAFSRGKYDHLTICSDPMMVCFVFVYWHLFSVKDIWCHVWPYFFLRLQVTRSNTRLHVRWAVSLVIVDGCFIFFWSLCESCMVGKVKLPCQPQLPITVLFFYKALDYITFIIHAVQTMTF